ncbi:hypothetical protein K504DRAFT_202676 [Pleomassaria siparia CBS 279.74]|uniref:Uncharacterized protein n=1 Tax=Pleomassaria siparia CBS 279.74 TaxID=1314801 RepID=A0A6G1KHR4_9PLEO|nr:hypothetical protein K504DRAFT_202676 [Pleomassaria siparia CBS 279.74]
MYVLGMYLVCTWAMREAPRDAVLWRHILIHISALVVGSLFSSPGPKAPPRSRLPQPYKGSLYTFCTTLLYFYIIVQYLCTTFYLGRPRGRRQFAVTRFASSHFLPCIVLGSRPNLLQALREPAKAAHETAAGALPHTHTHTFSLSFSPSSLPLSL